MRAAELILLKLYKRKTLTYFTLFIKLTATFKFCFTQKIKTKVIKIHKKIENYSSLLSDESASFSQHYFFKVNSFQVEFLTGFS